MRAIVAFAIAILGSAPAAASETITYTYDALGRLVQVARSGAVNNGLIACYGLDKASNRTSLTVGTGACPPPDGGGGGGAVTFAVSDASASEGSGLVFTVTKTGSTGATITVNFATANGTAVAPGDYTAKSGTLTFLAADTSKTVSVTTATGGPGESDETMLLNLSGASAGTIGDAQGIGTIFNEPNDPCPLC
ncbi:MAG: Calx-beta domain-containing protein [Sphingomicrobium sp.]